MPLKQPKPPINFGNGLDISKDIGIHSLRLIDEAERKKFPLLHFRDKKLILPLLLEICISTAVKLSVTRTRKQITFKCE